MGGLGKFLGAVAGIAGFVPGGQGFAAAAAAGAKLFPGDPLLRYYSPEASPGRVREAFPFGWLAWPAALTPRADPVCKRITNTDQNFDKRRVKVRIGPYSYVQEPLDVQIAAERGPLPKGLQRAPSLHTGRSVTMQALDRVPLFAFDDKQRAVQWDSKLFGGDALHPQRAKLHVGVQGLIPKEAILYRMADIAAGLELQRQGLDPCWALSQFSPVSKSDFDDKTNVWTRNGLGQLVFRTSDPKSVQPILRPGAPSAWDGWQSVSLTGRPVSEAHLELDQVAPILRSAWDNAMMRFADAIEVEQQLQEQVADLVDQVRNGEVTPAQLAAMLNSATPATSYVDPATGDAAKGRAVPPATSSASSSSAGAPSVGIFALLALASLIALRGVK